MELSFLSLLCRAYGLSIEDFYFLRNRKAREIFEYIAMKKQKARALLFAELREWRRLHKVWGSQSVLYPGHSHYPPDFLNVPDPPVYLSYAGDLGILELPQVAVVGSRTPHFRFLEWLEVCFSEFLTDKELSVVSGGAYGIDQKVSNLALLNGKKTVQLLPSGLEHIYPANIQDWRTNPHVLCLSEYLPHQQMRKHHFVVRNRLVAALGGFLFVVQAAYKSGSMITARYAMEFGKEIATLPDFPGVSESSGNLSMVKEGAQIIQSAADLTTIFERHWGMVSRVN